MRLSASLDFAAAGEDSAGTGERGNGRADSGDSAGATDDGCGAVGAASARRAFASCSSAGVSSFVSKILLPSASITWKAGISLPSCAV